MRKRTARIRLDVEMLAIDAHLESFEVAPAYVASTTDVCDLLTSTRYVETCIDASMLSC